MPLFDPLKTDRREKARAEKLQKETYIEQRQSQVRTERSDRKYKERSFLCCYLVYYHPQITYTYLSSYRGSA